MRTRSDEERAGTLSPMLSDVFLAHKAFKFGHRMFEGNTVAQIKRDAKLDGDFEDDASLHPS